jgi:hypothetical protein
MAANQDAALQVTAEVSMTRDEIVELCRRAAASLDGPYEVEVDQSTVAVFANSKVKKFQSARVQSPTIAIVLEESSPETFRVTAGASGYQTYQNKMWGLIPFGPKFMLGSLNLRAYLRALEAALRDLAPEASITSTLTPAD